jgi:hypothetical protein
MSSRTISISIACPAEAVYDFIADPEHLPAWAPGLARAVRRDGDHWILDREGGSIPIEFAPRNPFGVVDHRLTVRPDLTVLSHLRVIPNGGGAEVMLTLFQPDDVGMGQFEADAAIVEDDLQTLKRLLEAEET